MIYRIKALEHNLCYGWCLSFYHLSLHCFPVTLRHNALVCECDDEAWHYDITGVTEKNLVLTLGDIDAGWVAQAQTLWRGVMAVMTVMSGTKISSGFVPHPSTKLMTSFRWDGHGHCSSIFKIMFLD